MVDWYDKLRDSVRALGRRGRGCQWCSKSCLSEFAVETRLTELRQWHRQWRGMTTKEQDAHLLWIFKGDDRDVALNDGVGMRVDTSDEDSDSAKPAEHEEHTSTSDVSCDSDECSSDEETKEPERKKRRLYKDGARRRESYAIRLLGTPICRRAARHLMQVGEGRLRRVLEGRADMRSLRPHPPGPQISSVWRFLWTLYNNVAEGLPDKFSFATHDVRSGSIIVKTSKAKASDRVLHLKAEEEEQIRAIAAHSTYIESGRCPSNAVLTGPGIFRGPLRFLHPGKRIHLYWEYQLWADTMGLSAASFSTFLRAFSECEKAKVLKIRSVGDHAVCSTCAEFKTALRNARFPADRKDILEQYTGHISGQWLDRQVYENASALSLECRKLLEAGQQFISMARSASQISMAVDGMDQAKFRVPRVLIKTKNFEKLHRPALHVHGCWAHGFGYHLAVSDQDVKKNTATNIEVISRMLVQIFDTHKGLPLGLHLQQDNTSRECKNQKMLKWALKLVGLGVFKWITLNYLVKGHTHIDIDGTYGQLTVRLSRHEFDDDLAVVSLLLRFLSDLGIEPHARRGSTSYKLDEMPEWDEWIGDVPLQISSITGPRAPHWFKVCIRSDVEEHIVAAAEPFPGGHRPASGDVLVVIKHHMHDADVLQVCSALPESFRSNLSGEQPSGSAARRAWPLAGRIAVRKCAEKLFLSQDISAKARDYLVEWSSQTRVLHPKLSDYSFLPHRARTDRARSSRAPRVAPRVQPQLMRLQCRGPYGEHESLPIDPESCDDAEGNGPLAMVQL